MPTVIFKMSGTSVINGISPDGAPVPQTTNEVQFIVADTDAKSILPFVFGGFSVPGGVIPPGGVANNTPTNDPTIEYYYNYNLNFYPSDPSATGTFTGDSNEHSGDDEGFSCQATITPHAVLQDVNGEVSLHYDIQKLPVKPRKPIRHQF